MSLFNDDIIEKTPELSDEARIDLLLDYAFNRFCDEFLLVYEDYKEADYTEFEDSMHFFKSFFCDKFKDMFKAIQAGVPYWWFPDYLTPYKYVWWKGLCFKEEGDHINLILSYKFDESCATSIIKKYFIYYKEWSNFC